MFATLSSFLPSALQQGSPNPANTTARDVPPVVVEDPKPSDVIGATEEAGIKRKERRTNHEVRFRDLTSPLPILTNPSVPSRSSSYGLHLQSQITP
jgi:hypothetical protein